MCPDLYSRFIMVSKCSKYRTFVILENSKNATKHYLCMSIGTFGKLSSLGDSIRKHFKHRFSIIPSDASISNANTVSQSCLALLWNFLCAYILSVKLIVNGWCVDLPSLMLLSIMTPMMASSPFSICSARTAATFG